VLEAAMPAEPPADPAVLRLLGGDAGRPSSPPDPVSVRVVGLAGDVDPGAVIAMHRDITAALDAGDRRIVVDLTAVTLLGAQTAGLFCGALRRCNRRGATFEILAAPPHLRRALEIREVPHVRPIPERG
jgi:anti-anti-sigma factor